MHIFEGVKASRELINNALNDPNITFGFEVEFYLIGAQQAIQKYLTKGLQKVDAEDGTFYAKRIGDSTYSDVLHFWTPLTVDAGDDRDNHQIIFNRISKLYKEEVDKEVHVSGYDMWKALTEKYRVHQLMVLITAYPKDRLVGISENDIDAVEEFISMHDVKGITPFGKLNDVLFITAEEGFEPDDYNLDTNYATQDAMYHLIAKELEKKIGARVASSSNEVQASYFLTNKYQNWSVTSEPSLNKSKDVKDGFGIEVISPKFTAKRGVDELIRFLNLMQEGLLGLDVVTSMETGLHINIGVEEKEIDALKLLVLLGDEHIVRKFQRETNEFSQPTLVDLQKRVSAAGQGKAISASTPNELVQLTQNVIRKVQVDQSDIHRLTKLMDQLKPEGKSYSINFAKIPSGYVEFRAIGNADYEYRIDEIRSIVFRMLVISHIATEPDAFHQEFLKKVYKIVVNAIQSSEQPMADSQGGFMIGHGARGGYGQPIENEPLSQFDGEAFMHTNRFDPGSDTQ